MGYQPHVRMHACVLSKKPCDLCEGSPRTDDFITTSSVEDAISWMTVATVACHAATMFVAMPIIMDLHNIGILWVENFVNAKSTTKITKISTP